MGANKNSSIQKCGEILLNIKSKNRKTKMYIFQCTYCKIDCDQLKKFSIHLEENHLNNSLDNNFEDTKVKFEQEDELKVERNDELKIDFESTKQSHNNSDPLDTVNQIGPVINDDLGIKCDVKDNKKKEANCDINEIVDVKNPYENIFASNEKYGNGYLKDNEDERSMDYSTDEVEDINKTRRESITKKEKRFKLKQSATYMDFEGSNNEDKVEKEANTIKIHKRCKKRWKNIDDTKLPVLIETYKKHEVLWQVNDLAFGILPKRNETFGKMIEELKTNHNFDKNLDELQDYIDYLNYIFFKDREQELKCEIDKKEFIPSSKFYKELSFLSDSQGPFKCSNCNEIIGKYDRYHIHVAQHNGTIPFQCRLCEMGFQKFDNYLRHVTRHLGINSYHCKICGKGYPFKSELDWHMTSHTGVKPYLCPICGAGFRARHGYDNHIRRHEKRFRYECHICKHGFNHLCKLNTHIKSHLNIRDIICNVCGKGFTAVKYLQRHKLIHEEEKRYKCNVCGKAFAQDSGLRTHKKQHQPYATVAENKNLLNVFK